MKHDNFTADWNPDDEPHGTMIFTDVLSPPSPSPTDWKKEWEAANTTAKKLNVLAKMLGLE